MNEISNEKKEEKKDNQNNNNINDISPINSPKNNSIIHQKSKKQILTIGDYVYI